MQSALAHGAAHTYPPPCLAACEHYQSVHHHTENTDLLQQKTSFAETVHHTEAGPEGNLLISAALSLRDDTPLRRDGL